MSETVKEVEDQDEPHQEASPEETPQVEVRSFVPAKNYTKVDNRVLDYYLPLVGYKAVMLYVVYSRLLNKHTGYAYPSLERLGMAIGMSRQTIVKSNEALVKYKLLRMRQGTRGRSNQYTLLNPSPGEDIKSELREKIETGTKKPLADPFHLFPQGGQLEIPEVENGTARGSELDSQRYKTELPEVENGTVTRSILNQTNFKQNQQQPDPVLLDDQQEEYQDRDVVVEGSEISSEETEGIITELADIAKVDKAKAGKVINNLVEKHGAEMVSKQLVDMRGKYNIKNPIGYLTSACREKYEKETEPMNHPYKTAVPKTLEEIEADAKELRQGASVSHEDADRLASEYKSDYLWRSVAQIKKDAERGIVWGDFGATLVRRVESGYEPQEYAPRDRRLGKSIPDHRTGDFSSVAEVVASQA